MAEQFEKRLLRSISHADPLQLYLDYIAHLRDSTADESGGGKLADVVQRTLHAFMHSERYRNDERYVSVWLLYVRSIEAPNERLSVFKTMRAAGIGSQSLDFYESFVRCVETVDGYAA